MREQPAPRSSSANRSNRREKIPPRLPSFEMNRREPGKIRQLTSEEFLDFLPPKRRSSSKTKQPAAPVDSNLPEFLQFQSDHLVLVPQIVSHPFYDRLRGSSAFSTTKFNRQSAGNTTANDHIVTAAASVSAYPSGGSPRSTYTSTKRLSRSRQTHDTTMNVHAQQQAAAAAAAGANNSSALAATDAEQI